MKRIMACLVILTFIALGCNTISDEAEFETEIWIDPLSKLKPHEEIVFRAEIKSKNKFKITHASGIFYFTIMDDQGEQINNFGMTLPQLRSTIHSSGIAEDYRFTFKEPGEYVIISTAKFSIETKEEKKDFELKDTLKITIN